MRDLTIMRKFIWEHANVPDKEKLDFHGVCTAIYEQFHNDMLYKIAGTLMPLENIFDIWMRKAPDIFNVTAFYEFSRDKKEAVLKQLHAFIFDYTDEGLNDMFSFALYCTIDEGVKYKDVA